jgi:hypothetical protein
MIIRVIRNAVVMCALSGSFVSLHASQQKQAEKSQVTLWRTTSNRAK